MLFTETTPETKEDNDLIFGEDRRVNNESAPLIENIIIFMCDKGESTSYTSFHFVPSSFTILVVSLDHSPCLSLSLFFKITSYSFNVV